MVCSLHSHTCPLPEAVANRAIRIIAEAREMAAKTELDSRHYGSIALLCVTGKTGMTLSELAAFFEVTEVEVTSWRNRARQRLIHNTSFKDVFFEIFYAIKS